MKKNEPKTVNGRDGWRARLRCANAEAASYLSRLNQFEQDNCRLRQALERANQQIIALDEFGATMVEVVQDYHKGKITHG